jgi:hypothetical protein
MGRQLIMSLAVMAALSAPALAGAPGQSLPQAHAQTGHASQHASLSGAAHSGHAAHHAHRLYGNQQVAVSHVSSHSVQHSSVHHGGAHHGGAITHGVTHHGLHNVCGGAYGACTPIPARQHVEIEHEVIVERDDVYVSLDNSFFAGSGGVGYYEDLGVYGGGGIIIGDSFGGGVLGSAGRRDFVLAGINRESRGGFKRGGKGGCGKASCGGFKGHGVKGGKIHSRVGYRGRSMGGSWGVRGMKGHGRMAGHRGGKMGGKH